MSLQRSIFVRTSFVGFHAWQQAPTDVAYLRHQHRHVFGIEVRVNVTHSDRDVEYHMLLADVRKVINGAFTFLDGSAILASMSCEHIAETIGHTLLEQMNYSVRSVQVDEDGENGSLVEGFQ